MTETADLTGLELWAQGIDLEALGTLVSETVRELFLVPFPGNPSFFFTPDDCSCVVCHDGDGYLDRYMAVSLSSRRFSCEGSDDLHELIDLVNGFLNAPTHEVPALLERLDYLGELVEAYLVAEDDYLDSLPND